MAITLLSASSHLMRGIRSQLGRRWRWIQAVSAAPASSIIRWDVDFIGHNIVLGSNTVVESHVLFRAGLKGDKHEYIKIGNHCRIWNGAELHSHGGFIRMGDYCSINPYSIIYGSGGITIGNYVRIATHTVIVASMHVFDRVDMPIKSQGCSARGIVIEDDVWIGAGVSILDGVTIGKGAVVAAGAVVNRDVPPYHVVAGVPGKIVKQRSAGQRDER